MLFRSILRIDDRRVDVGEDLSVLTETAEIDAKAETATLGLSSARPKRAAARPSGPKHKFQAPTEDITREVELGESITVAALAKNIGESC